VSNRDQAGGESNVSRVDAVSRPTRQRWVDRIDALLILLLGGALVPSVLVNIVLWRERLQGIALYDFAVGGDSAWQARPLLMPLVVAAAATVRLCIPRRRWPLSGRLMRAHAIALSVAVLTAAAAFIPAPTVFPD
jgi:hypothetical protein